MSSLRYFDGVRFGAFQNLEVLVDPADNSLWIGQPSVARMLGWDNNRAPEKIKSKSLKAFAGKRLALTKSIAAKDSLGRPNKINALPYDTFLAVVWWQLAEGNPLARDLVFAGFADSFSSIVLEQCGIKLSLDQRQQTVSFYLQGYHVFQDWVRDRHRELYGVGPDQEYYRQMAVTINRYLFNRDHFNKNRKANASDKELRKIENFQMVFMEHSHNFVGVDPLQAVEAYIKGWQDWGKQMSNRGLIK